MTRIKAKAMTVLKTKNNSQKANSWGNKIYPEKINNTA